MEATTRIELVFADRTVASTLGAFRRGSKWQQRRHEDLKKYPGGEDEKEHGCLVVMSRPIPSLLGILPESQCG
jgi:hypothetical protein